MTIDQTISSTTSAQGSRKLDEAQKIKLSKAVREFESVFVGYMLKSMRNTVEKADNSTDSFGADMLESLFDVELAKHISQSSNLGLAELLYRKMTGESLSAAHRALGTKPIQELLPDSVLQNLPTASTQKNPARVTTSAVNDNAVSRRKEIDAGVEVPGRSSVFDRLRHYETYVAEAADKFGVKDSLIKAVIAAESSALPDAQSPRHAKGLMQLVDSTADELGVKNVWDPRENILGGTKYLKQLLERHDGDESLALASYNAGPGTVKKYGGIPPFKETTQYVARVLRLMNVFQQQETNND